MDFDFLQEYNNYPTLELLRIIRWPGHYQPAAVEAAHSVLSKRNISPEEMEEANRQLLYFEEGEKRKQEKIDALKANVTSALSSLMIPDQELKPSKWLKFLLFLLAIQYVRYLYKSFQTIVWFFKCDSCQLDPLWLFALFNLLYIPFIFFLLLKGKKWGWIILFGENIFSAVLLSMQFVMALPKLGQSIYSLDFLKVDPLNFVWPIVFRTLFLIFLLKKDIAQYFRIDRLATQRTFMAAVLLALSFMAAVHFFY